MKYKFIFLHLPVVWGLVEWCLPLFKVYVALCVYLFKAFLDVKSALKTYQAATISLESQEEAFKNAQERYNYGSMTLFDFDQVRTRLVNAQSTLIRSKYDYVFKTKVLQFYAGELILN